MDSLAVCSCNQEVYNYKIAARPERRRQFEKELISQMEVALSVLTACLSINELKEQVGAVDPFGNLLILAYVAIWDIMDTPPFLVY